MVCILQSLHLHPHSRQDLSHGAARDDIPIRKGDTVVIATQNLHQDPRYWEIDSTKFIPEQFLNVDKTIRFYLGLHNCRSRLRCINLYQESSSCQTTRYNQIKQECTLFSEHVEYNSGRLYDENNENLITIRLDKDSFEDLHKTIKTKKNLLVIVSSRYQKI
ncbi:unnamed protein product [Adineta steineri]|uniref:Apple domain-containing protein n=1 Tax=Adineta steineri TaxID=433720 RepID=A0A819ZRD8_9BILA|nr:unnamed protein product [Adineta steineri]CAF4178039.1 unnamed protein product [Adineta steineri]